MEDRSALFNQLKGFSQRKLKKVETKVVTGLGEQLVEKRGAKGLQVLSGGAGPGGESQAQQEPARKLDLQVGMVLPGLLIGSDDVASDKSSLESYGVTHILNLAPEVANKFDDDYNYKNVALEDRADFQLERVLDDCFDFLDDGRHYGNVLVHCQGTIGLSRATSVCVAYLMAKEAQGFQEAWNNVKEARSFVKPNEGFQKQLRDYEVKLRGAAKAKESGIDDPFALRKKQEIEQEKAMVAGAASVKNRMKMFGANLDANANSNAPADQQRSARAKSGSPSPYGPGGGAGSSNDKNASSSPSTTTARPASKWSAPSPAPTTPASKSLTPEPRSWRQSQQTQQQQSQAPPPPPPMPATSLHDKSIKPTKAGQLPPPPPPPPAPGDLLRDKPSSSNANRNQPSANASQRKGSVSSGGDSDESSGKRVFGRRPPPAMKLRGGVSMERQESSEASENVSPSKQTGASVQRNPMLCVEIERATNFQQLKSNFSNLQQQQPHAQCMTATLDRHRPRRHHELGAPPPPGRLDQRCPSPLVLMNNVSPAGPRGGAAPATGEPLAENPFKYWQNTLASSGGGGGGVGGSGAGRDSLASSPLPPGQAAPKRTVSLGPKRRSQIGEHLQQNPFLRNRPQASPERAFEETKAAAAERRDSFSKAARELQSSLTQLDQLIRSPAPSAAPPVPPHRNLRAPVCEPASGADDEDAREPRYAWQEDLANWKASSSVNDLRSMFVAKSPAPGLELPPARPRLSSTSNVLKRAPVWPSVESGRAPAASPSGAPQGPLAAGRPASADSDYALRRTVSSASGARARPELRNPYRGHYAA